ncbi:MAG: Lactoylglutathione lyase-like protein [Ignavibacteria bacterium]|nr:MAG: Lactoylglutathione lyase-like protein [Ignavibacteria bacterium]KAF0160518.1 MAG: Lactoylglutathione lyase-like protein [Ignavibacteria bacterium]
MSELNNEPGVINWSDLTVPNAELVRDFYSHVVGWKFEFVSMGEYSDYVMLTPETKTPTAGICHALGTNSNLPTQWLLYINVANIDESIASCQKLGGKLLAKTKNYAGMGKYCVIQDPAGAVCALFEPSAK